MAGTYGEPGKNTFTLPGVGGILSPVVNSETGTTQIYRQDALLNFKSLGTYNPKTKKFTAFSDAGLTDSEKTALSSEGALTAYSDNGQTATKKGAQAAGKTVEESEKISQTLFPSNKAASGTTDGDEQLSTAQSDISSAPSGRMDFNKNSPLYYPDTLAKDFQDVIVFEMLKYKPKGALVSSTGEAANTSINPLAGGRAPSTEVIGSVILPSPAGIMDRNQVEWGSGNLSSFQAMGITILESGMRGGIDQAATTTGNFAESASNNTGAIGDSIASRLVSGAVGTNPAEVLSRTKGVVENPNMELLFRAPTLRPFSFTFKLSPRNGPEAKKIIKIIRFFKQGMSPIRSQKQFFLRAPHTFRLTYKHINQQHKFLNMFKECALQSFSVNYTPEGQYATYVDGSMVSYEISMEFQELEPVYNDDYSRLVPGGDSDTHIGF